MAMGYRNVNKLRRKLRNMEKFVESGIGPAIERAAYAIELDAKARVRVDEGDLQRSITHKLGRDKMTAVIGPGAKSAAVARAAKGSPFATRSTIQLGSISKHDLFQFFKGYWIEFGTKGAPDRNIPPQPARPFMQPAFDVNKTWATNEVRREVNRQLERLAKGV